jgi:uncharacterized protein (TIGR02284 family)
MDTNAKLMTLLRLCADGVAGYRHAALAIREPKLHTALWQNASEREEIGAVITNALVSRGVKPDHEGSAKGAVHRVWLDAIAALESNNTAAILHECERGDVVTCNAFEDAIDDPAASNVREMLVELLSKVFAARARISKARTT